MNECHDAEDGRFCEGGGSSGGAQEPVTVQRATPRREGERIPPKISKTTGMIGRQKTPQEIYSLPDVEGSELQVVTRSDGNRAVATFLIPEDQRGKGLGQSMLLAALADGDIAAVSSGGVSDAYQRVQDRLIAKGVIEAHEDEYGVRLLSLAKSKSHMNDCHGDDGKFCEGGGSSGGSGAPKSGSGTSRPSQSIRREGKAWKTSDGKDLPKHLDGLRIPPAWTDVQVNPDPEGSLLVTGHDAKGRLQYVYSAKFMDTQKAAKFERITALDREFDQIKSANSANRADPARAEEADCLHLIMETGIRPGSDRDTKAAKQAFGATTLRGEHVKQTDSGVRLQYVGKKGVDLDIPISNPETARMLVDRAERAGASGRLFDTDSHTLLAYTHTLGSGSFKTKDFRTLVGTSMAKTEIAKLSKPTTKAAFKKQVSAVAKAVAAKLGNTPSVALKSYIAPEVFAPWQSETEDTAKAHSDGEPLFDFGVMIGTACSLRHRDAGIFVRDEGDADGNDEDIPCPPEVRMALGFDPDDLDEDKSNACACVGDHCFFGNAEAVDPAGHVAVLQGLNEWIDYARPTGPQRFFYGTDDFTDSVQDWERVPVVFAQQHPAHRLIASNLEGALQSVRAHDGGPGRIAGSIRMPMIVDDALMSEVAFDDPYVQRMHAERRLALSTGFTAGHDETGHLTETVKPNHLLVFVTDESNRPRDPNTGFLNKEGDDVIDEEQERPEGDQPEDDGRLRQLVQSVLKALDSVFVQANALSKAANDPGDPSAGKETPEEQKPAGEKKPTDEEKQKGNMNDCHSEDGRFCGEGGSSGGSKASKPGERSSGGVRRMLGYSTPVEEKKVIAGSQVDKGSPWETSLKGAERDLRDEIRYKELKSGHGASNKMIALRMAANESPNASGNPEGDTREVWEAKLSAFKAVDIAEDEGQVHPSLAGGYRAVIANSPDLETVKGLHSHIKALGGMFRHQSDEDFSNAEYPFDTCVEDQIAKGYDQAKAEKICGYIKAKNNLLSRSVMGGRSPNGADSEEVIMGIEMDTLKSQLEAANKTVADQKTELEAANQRLAAFKKKEADVAWANMRDTHVPKGWLAGKTDEEKANKESELRKEFEDAPIAFANKLLAHAKGLPKGGDKSAEEGNSYANKDGDGGANDVVSTTRELRALSGRR